MMQAATTLNQPKTKPFFVGQTTAYEKAKLALAAGQMVDAAKWFQLATQENPELVDAHYQLARIEAEIGNLHYAVHLFNELVRRVPHHVDALHDLGYALFRLNRSEMAENCLKHALALRPDHPLVHNSLGILYEALGNKKLSEAHYLTAMRDSPNEMSLLYNYVNSRTNQAGEMHTERARHLYNTPYITGTQRMYLCFALGKIYDDLGQPRLAFDYYAEANSLQAKQSMPDMVAIKRMHETIRNELSAEKLATLSGHGLEDETPIFIVGMPRSGSSLVEQMLASHPAVYGGGELELMCSVATEFTPGLTHQPFPFRLESLSPQARRELGQQYVQMLRSYSDSPRVTDKMPSNYLYIGLIHTILPKARVIWCRRDAVDNCFSIWKRHFPNLGSNYSNRFETLAQAFKLQESLMQHWQETLPGFVHELRYEELVQNPEHTLRSLLSYCGLEWNEACLRFHENTRLVNTASKHQVRRPIYRGAMQSWKPVEDKLRPLIDALKS